MFSSRTNWNFLPNCLTQLLEQKHKRNEPIVDLTESNPTKCGFRYDSSGLLATIADERSLRYDPNPKGLLAAREAVCEFYLRKNFRLDPEQVILTASTSEAYSFLLRLLCNPGDSVLVPQPSYPLFDDLCQLNDVEMTPYRLSYDGEWHIDAASLGTVVSKALILVHPNNPTGSFVKLEEEKLIVDVAQKKNLAIIADEVFSEYGFGANQHRVETFAYTDVVLTFTLGGISKLLGLPQMKLAWIVVSGPDQLRTEALKRLEFISDTYLSVHSAVQRALPQLLKGHSLITQEIRKRVVENYEFLRSAVTISPGVSLFHCEGGWSAILRLPGIRSDDEWCELFLQSANILFHPGHFYSLDSKACVVVSLLPEPGVFQNAFTRALHVVTKEMAVKQ